MKIRSKKLKDIIIKEFSQYRRIDYGNKKKSEDLSNNNKVERMNINAERTQL